MQGNALLGSMEPVAICQFSSVHLGKGDCNRQRDLGAFS